MLAFSALNTSNAVRLEWKTKFFVPMFLLLGKEDEGPIAITAFAFDIVVVRHRDRRRDLPRQVSEDCRVRDPALL